MADAPRDTQPTPAAPAERRFSWRHPRFPLHVHISLLFTILLLTSGLLIGVANYSRARMGLLDASKLLFGQLAETMELSLQHLRSPTLNLVSALSYATLCEEENDAGREPYIPMLLSVLSDNPFLAAVYVGYDDGDFFIARHLQTPDNRAAFFAPPSARFLVQRLDRNGDAVASQGHFYDKEQRPIGPGTATDKDFDPRTRPWYRSALSGDGPTQTDPYVFFATKEVGQTISRRAPNGKAVVGLDITLTRISSVLAILKPTPSSLLLLFDKDERVVASSAAAPPVRAPPETEGVPELKHLDDFDKPPLPALRRRIREGIRDSAVEFADSGDRYWTLLVSRLRGPGEEGLRLAVAAPTEELLADAKTQLQWAAALTAVVLAFSVPLTWYLSRRVSRDLTTLTGMAASIRRFNLTDDLRMASWIREVDELSTDLAHTQRTIRHFLELSANVASEHDFNLLVDTLLAEMMRMAEAKSGVLYLMSEDGQSLTPATARLVPTPSPDAAPHDARTEPVDGFSVSLADMNAIDVANPSHPEFTDAIREGRPMSADLPSSALPGASLRERWGEDRVQAIGLPLRNNSGENVGLILLFRRTENGRAPNPEHVAFLRQLSGVAAIAIDNHRLLRAQENLMRGLIQILAGAIDAKSPYTGGHCQRVPVIATMLAEAACDAREGPFAGYSLGRDEWNALYVASWLHDCGKVTTPEFVVDKATKLETIHDRIHEVRMRFEVLKRDAEIACLKAVAAGANRTVMEEKLARETERLDEDFAFVAQCNLGGESQDPASVERLSRIARRTWKRTLSDRAGIGWEERQRHEAAPETPLPADEPLLADKPEHIIPRPGNHWTAGDNPWGFKIKVPEHKFNRGELYNLSVAHGTLTDEERFIINDHIMQTIIMLSRLTFPTALKRVPEIAGGHHERIDGHGYPKELTGDQMSTEAKMMAIADVFEALTAADRPYKKAKTLSESLGLMAGMSRDGHLDPELFALFVKGGVPQRYAKDYLRPEQFDEVDTERLLADPRA